MNYTDESCKRRVFAVRVNTQTPDIVDSIAKDLDCLRITGDGVVKGATGILLDKIAKGDLVIVPATPD